MRDREQHNTRIRNGIIGQVNRDSRAFSKTKDIVTEVALEYFFTSVPKAKRESFYRNHQPYARAAK